MSQAARDLVTQAEEEAGCFFDDQNNPTALAVLYGAVFRTMSDVGLESLPRGYTEHDDCIVGSMLLHQRSPAGQREQERNEMMANFLRSGMSPEELKSIFG